MKLYSPKASTELFHLILLDLLGRKVDKRHYALKGGGNLRFFFQSIRYSEDMDLDVSATLTKDKLQDVMSQILESKTIEQILDVKGIRIQEKSSPKQTDTTQRWKFKIAVPGTSVSLRTKIEFLTISRETCTEITTRGIYWHPKIDGILPLVVHCFSRRQPYVPTSIPTGPAGI